MICSLCRNIQEKPLVADKGLKRLVNFAANVFPFRQSGGANHGGAVIRFKKRIQQIPRRGAHRGGNAGGHKHHFKAGAFHNAGG